MKNKIHYVTSQKMNDIMETIKRDNSLFIAVIDGKKINYPQDYFDTISEIFQFPTRSLSFASYNDWMRDLDWLNKKGYALVINNFRDLLSEEPPDEKNTLLKILTIIYCHFGKKKCWRLS